MECGFNIVKICDPGTIISGQVRPGVWLLWNAVEAEAISELGSFLSSARGPSTHVRSFYSSVDSFSLSFQYENQASYLLRWKVCIVNHRRTATADNFYPASSSNRRRRREPQGLVNDHILRFCECSCNMATSNVGGGPRAFVWWESKLIGFSTSHPSGFFPSTS